MVVITTRRGGVGCVIRDSSGNVFQRFSVFVEASNANEAETFALLVGCQELVNLSVILAIIEGDSFSAIYCGSGKISHSWRLVDWVEEVQDISPQLDPSFHHIIREANDMADDLTREGVFRDSVSFNI